MSDRYDNQDAAYERDMDRETSEHEEFVTLLDESLIRHTGRGLDDPPFDVPPRPETDEEIAKLPVLDMGHVRSELERIRPTRTLHVPVKEPNLDQLSIDSLTPAQQEATLQARFEQFHRANPHVYQQLVRLARRFKRAGNEHCGIGMLFEVLRYRAGLTTLSADQFKLNNNHRSRYARLIMAQEPDLAGFFETRELHAR